MILIDTSVWIDHFQSKSDAVAEALDLSEVLIHPFVIGEIACGLFRRRREVLDLLSELPQVTIADDEEVLLFIEKYRLMGKGIGYIDAHLLAAVTLTEDTQLWTHDKRLAAAAAELRLDLLRH